MPQAPPFQVAQPSKPQVVSTLPFWQSWPPLSCGGLVHGCDQTVFQQSSSQPWQPKQYQVPGKPSKDAQRNTVACLPWWKEGASRRNLRNREIEQKTNIKAKVRGKNSVPGSMSLRPVPSPPSLYHFPYTDPSHSIPLLLLFSSHMLTPISMRGRPHCLGQK